MSETVAAAATSSTEPVVETSDTDRAASAEPTRPPAGKLASAKRSSRRWLSVARQRVSEA